MKFDESELFYQQDSESSIEKLNKEIEVKRYDGPINYQSGMTAHYEENRIIREKELKRLLGEGKRTMAFTVNRANKEPEIQEIRDNAIIIVYSFNTHKRITLFAPPPRRLEFLYNSIGEIADENIMIKSEENAKKGYNRIYNYI